MLADADPYAMFVFGGASASSEEPTTRGWAFVTRQMLLFGGEVAPAILAIIHFAISLDEFLPMQLSKYQNQREQGQTNYQLNTLD